MWQCLILSYWIPPKSMKKYEPNLKIIGMWKHKKTSLLEKHLTFWTVVKMIYCLKFSPLFYSFIRFFFTFCNPYFFPFFSPQIKWFFFEPSISLPATQKKSLVLYTKEMEYFLDIELIAQMLVCSIATNSVKSCKIF